MSAAENDHIVTNLRMIAKRFSDPKEGWEIAALVCLRAAELIAAADRLAPDTAATARTSIATYDYERAAAMPTGAANALRLL